MTVLLIERCGRVHELEIPALVDRLFIPLHTGAVAAGARDAAPALTYATFALSDEWSYPPVYRWAPS